MKKIFFAFVAFVLCIAQTNAQSITFSNVEVPEKGQGELVVNYSTGGKTIVSYGFTIKLPEGLSFVMTDGEPNVIYEGGKGVNLTYKDGNFGFLPKNDEVQITGDGVLLKLTLQAGEKLKQNDEFEVEVTSLGMTDSDLKDVPIANTTFTVKIIENRITLDENATELPDVSGTQNVLVKRTIKAGKGKDNWGTICLPFAMTGEQVKAAFGDDVEFADFTGYTASYDDDDFVTSIEVSFASVDISTGIAANHPYIINLGKDATEDISEFRVDNVNIAFEEEPMIHFGTSRKYKDFVGTYTVINNLGSTAEPCLFLSGNKFYYATGKTKMKAYRAYFAFYEYLKEFDPEAGGAKISFSVDGDATSIDGIGTQRIVEGVYDLSGRKIKLEDGDVTKLQKGVYIINGKKVTIK